MLKRSLLVAGAACVAASGLARPLAADDLVMLNRLSEPAVSRDGRLAAFTLRETDLKANRGRTDLFLLALDTPGRPAVRFQPSADTNESAPAFSSDGRTLYYLSTRGGSSQLWSAPVSGGPARQVTKLPVDISGFALAPTDDRVALWAEMDVGCQALACVADRAAAAKAPGSGRVYDQLFVRHWDTWAGPARSQLFTVALTNGMAVGDAVRVSGGLVGDVPSKPLGGGEEISWSPDGRTIYFALREAGHTEPWSTNLDIFAAAADGSGKPVNLTAANRATDTLPTVSPDGRMLAWAAMTTPGYEADKLTIWIRDLRSGATRALTKGWDRSVDSIAWAADSRSLLVTALDTGRRPVFRVDVASGRVRPLTAAGTTTALVPSGSGALAVLDRLTAPADLYHLDAAGRTTRLTNVNADRLAGIAVAAAEQMRFEGANGDTVYAWVVKPAGLKPGQRAPLAFLVHGGPQSSFGDAWSYRWNAQVWAGAGYAVVMVDFHGSTGYGQAFTDSINNDWGGKPLEDLKRGLAAAGARYDWIDTQNACAAGGSYGGFMMNWIAGHWSDGFKCLVNHAGIFDLRSMYYGTEELWFPEHEFGGPYHAAAQNYERWNPANAVTRWRTPMLVIHGQQDFRVPYLQGIQTFTALQRQRIPSRLVMFPDEHHWILKPANSLQWHREVLGWLDKHLRK